MFSPASLLLTLLLASYVSAHGHVSQITVNGKVFKGNRPTNQRGKTASPIRQINSPNPIYGANNAAVNCGNGGGFVASDVASVNPGDVLKFDWRGADGSRWPHNTGPILSYLADCGSTSCDKFDSKKARWFKIDQQGHKPNSAEWVQQDLMNGRTADVKLPSNIAPGNYLMRHEVIGLHLAARIRGAEFYPACVQLKIGGSGTGKPTANELVSFPGGYSDNDKGLFGKNFFSRQYDFPGPPVAKLAGGRNVVPASDAPASSSTSKAAASTPTTRAAASTSTTKAAAAPAPTQTKAATPPKGSSSGGGCKRSNTGDVHARHARSVKRRMSFEGSAHDVSV